MLLPVGAVFALALVSFPLEVGPRVPIAVFEAPAVQVGGEVIAALQVHGNVLTPQADILTMSGVAVGEPFLSTTVDDVANRLRQAGRFRSVEVRKRFESFTDPSRIVVVIIVDEGPVRLEVPEDRTRPILVVRRRGVTNLMLLPILSAEDGYGVTAGVRLSYVGVSGADGRLSFPFTIGGERRAAAEFDRPLSRGPVTRLQAGVAATRVHNPAFDADDQRERAWGRVERAIGPVRAGGTLEWQRVSFAGREDEVASGGIDVSLDTRRDPAFPRNAVVLSAGWTRLDFRSGMAVSQGRWQALGYVGLMGQTVLHLGALREGASGPLPPAFQSILGGSANLRGFRRGVAAGDNLVAGTLELFVPLSSPLGAGRLGANVFADAGAAYAHDERLVDQRLLSGFGAGVWLSLAAFRIDVSVARGRHDGTRVHFTAGVGN